MAKTITMHVSGLSELGRRMSTLKSDIALKTARSATGAAANIVKKLAKAHILSSPSVDTRSLYESVIVKKLPKKDTVLTSEHIVTVRGRGKKSKKTGITQTSAPHAHFVEFGTVKMPAEPFLRPGFEEGKAKAVDAMIDRLRKRIEKAGG